MCLKQLRVKKPKAACEIVKCCATLHNLCMRYKPGAVPVNPLEQMMLNNMGLEVEAQEEGGTEDVPEHQTVSTHAGKARRKQLVSIFDT